MAVDLTIVLLLLWGIVNGARKGFVRQVVSLAVLVAGLMFACHYHRVVSAWLSQYIIIDDGWMTLLIYVGAFILIALLMSAVGWLLEWLLKAVLLGWLNRLAGAVFGFLKHLLVLSFVICLLNDADRTLHFLPPNLAESSKLYGAVGKVAAACFPSLTSEKPAPAQHGGAGAESVHSV